MTIGTESPIYRMINNTGSYGTSKNENTPLDDHTRHTKCLKTTGEIG